MMYRIACVCIGTRSFLSCPPITSLSRGDMSTCEIIYWSPFGNTYLSSAMGTHTHTATLGCVQSRGTHSTRLMIAYTLSYYIWSPNYQICAVFYYQNAILYSRNEIVFYLQGLKYFLEILKLYFIFEIH